MSLKGAAGGSDTRTVASSAIPFIHISSGSIGNNGALSGVTALPVTYSGGAYVYYPAGAIAAGVPAAAAWYWTVFSSATAGTIFNSVYTTGTPVMGTATAFATTGPGAFTGDTANLSGVLIDIAGGALGSNGAIDVTSMWSVNNTAGAKTAFIKYSGTGGTTYLQSSLASTLSSTNFTRIANRGSASTQVGTSTAIASGFGNSGAALTYGTTNTGVATQVFLGPQKTGAATDYVILENFTIRVTFAV